MEAFHSDGYTLSLKVPLNRGPIYGTSPLVHCLITAFVIPLVPGALNGFNLLIALLICSSEIGSYLNALFRYMDPLLTVVCSFFGAGKKVLKSILALLSFVLAVHVVLSPCFAVSAGSLALLPSDASADVYLWTLALLSLMLQLMHICV